jgi:5-methyltetrahydropteroyltriglutamate--homocysteine methyltransferase
MKRSTDRILTTHIGSLPRPADLLDASRNKDQAPELHERILRDQVNRVVRRQVDVGLDIIDDGEFGKPGFIHYINERLGGFEVGEIGGNPFGQSREHRDFPQVYAALSRGEAPSNTGGAAHMVCTSPVTYTGQAQLQRDIDNLKTAAEGLKYTELFMPSVSPSSVEHWQSNRYYKTQEEYLFAIAEALGEEYKAITDAGIVVQIDDPHLSMMYVMRPEMSIEDAVKWAEVRVEAVNHALANVPRDMVRWHTCYGIDVGPRVHDLELKHILHLILRIKAAAYSFEGANPRHEHEYALWEDFKLPEGSTLIPGVITHSSVLVEHPELVKQRLVRYANLVGKENVIAAADCGFGTFASLNEVGEAVAWPKFQALVQGAEMASKELWGR